jgi:hypothetical protein
MAHKGQGVLLVYMDLMDPKYEEEFNAWYNTEHLPELLALPGVLDAARYVATKGGPKYLAAYELASVDALQTSEYKNRPRTPWGKRVGPTAIGKNRARIVGQQIFPSSAENPDRGMAAALQIGRMSVPESADTAWNTWYNSEYIPGYRKVQGVICARRFRVIEGEVRYTTLYEFEHDKVSESPEWNYQREHSSPNSGRMREVMTMAAGSPGVYRRIYP